MRWYLKQNAKLFIVSFLCCLAYNLYFINFLPGTNRTHLYYADVLIGVGMFTFSIIDYVRAIEKKKADEREADRTDVLKNQLDEQFEVNCNLQDYIAKWCHEVKIPLSALLLMNENIEDAGQRVLMREQLERIRQQLNMALIGCRTQSSIYDLQIHKTDLKKCVKESIKNNQFFLIRKHFEIEMKMEDVFVYTDSEWLIYVMDQIISNAVKYACESPKLRIDAKRTGRMVRLFVEDNGAGIKECDLHNVFEKGFTGSNHHNGKYKSTGMGLYLAKLIVERMGHSIKIESEFGKYTRVILEFWDNEEHFRL